MPSPIEETYLGDGLYASFDGFQVCLRAPRLGGDHKVYLEPTVLRDFIRYVVKHVGAGDMAVLYREHKHDA